MWFVEYTDNFHDWWLGLTEAQQDVITSKVELLQEDGPSLGRPSVDTIRGSRHPNMKELRAAKAEPSASCLPSTRADPPSC